MRKLLYKQIVFYETWQRNGRSVMLMLLFVSSLSVSATALVSIIALLIALIHCVPSANKNGRSRRRRASEAAGLRYDSNHASLSCKLIDF